MYKLALFELMQQCSIKHGKGLTSFGDGLFLIAMPHRCPSHAVGASRQAFSSIKIDDAMSALFTSADFQEHLESIISGPEYLVLSSQNQFSFGVLRAFTRIMSFEREGSGERLIEAAKSLTCFIVRILAGPRLDDAMT